MNNFIRTLGYTIPAGRSRRVAWADQAGGYIDVVSDQCSKGAGYVYGHYCRLKDLVLCDTQGIKSRKQLTMSVLPGTISIQVDDHRMDAALLLGIGAFWVRFSSACALILPKSSLTWNKARETTTGPSVYLIYREAQKPRKPAAKENQEELRPSPEALAIAAYSPLNIEEIHSPIPLPEGYGLYLLTGSENSRESTATTEVYLAWAEEAAGACAKGIDLLRTDGYSNHQTKIEQFFKRFSFRSGCTAVDQALAWAAFSGWTLVTREYGLGIWAGLPWFRDNWGRDTFIALPGILLVTGQYNAAREVLATFAERQDQDPTSPNFGRIPNRWRNPRDVIFNTVDGTPWFIREVWEYVQYTGDTAFALTMKPFVDRALEADLNRCDQYGFLTHGPADTWMDARIRGKDPWSERSNRAVEVQALFYTALRCGQLIADLAGDHTRAEKYRKHAESLRRAFISHFWHPEHQRLADRLLDPADPESISSVEPDLRSRPNALLAITVPELLPAEEALLPRDIQKRVLADVCKELVYPYGVASLSQQDPYFHPYHDNYPLYHKDAAYHNGTIWGWNAGFTIQALLMFGQTKTSWALQQELARQIMEDDAVGTLSENLHAMLNADGLPRHSGTFSQAWSVSEFVRVGLQYWLGIQFRLADGMLLCSPRFSPDLVQHGEKNSPSGFRQDQWELSGTLSFGQGSRLHLGLRIKETRQEPRMNLFLLWDQRGSGDPEELNLLFTPPADRNADAEAPVPLADLRRTLVPHHELVLEWPYKISKPDPFSTAALSSAQALLTSQGVQDLQQTLGLRGFHGASPELPPFNQPSREKDYLVRQILSGSYNKGPIESLRSWYDSKEFAQQFLTDEALGANCTAYYTDFKIWAPTAAEVELLLWESGGPERDNPAAAEAAAEAADGDAGGGPVHEEQPWAVHRMYRQNRGVWHLRLHGDFHGMYYTYRLRIHSLDRETIDPYAKSAGLNGKRGMILDPRRLEPEGWQNWAPPQLTAPADAIIWEAHIRDLTSHSSWQGPEELRCTYLGAAHAGTTCGSIPTGFDYIRALGITHIQLLPIFDFVSVDEGRVRDPDYRAQPQNGAFNWGYDPGNYMAPEGSYATKPADGASRFIELRRLVQALGQAGIGVIMDVVYNHVPDRRRSALEACVPGYYFRGRRDSGAGDDTASERYMFRKYMIDTLSWWLSAFKLSGFRFDLMGLHDVTTMQAIARDLKRIKSDVLLYGEGWNMYGGNQTGKKSKFNLEMASQLNIHKLANYGMFNDAFRDGLKGSVFDASGPGWIHDGRNTESVKFGLLGAVHHHQVHNHQVTGTARPQPWTDRSYASINYLEVHDNLTLFDKLQLVEPGRDRAYYGRLQRLALTLLLTSQGIPVLHAGMEFLRTKEVPEAWLKLGGIDKCVTDPVTKRQFCHDSYKAGDRLNGLNWEWAQKEIATVAYVQYLIGLRKRRPTLHLAEGDRIRRAICFLYDSQGILLWQIDGRTAQDPHGTLLIGANSKSEAVSVSLPQGNWRILANSATAETWEETAAPAITQHILIPGKGALVLSLPCN